VTAHAAHGGVPTVALTEPEYLKWLLDSLASMRVLLIITHRLGYAPPVQPAPRRGLEAHIVRA